MGGSRWASEDPEKLTPSPHSENQQDRQQQDLEVPVVSRSHQGTLWKAWDVDRIPASAALNPGFGQQPRPGNLIPKTENLQVGHLVQTLTLQTRKIKAREAE